MSASRGRAICQVDTPQGYTWRVEIPEDLLQEQVVDRGEIEALQKLITSMQGQVDAQAGELAAKNEQIRELHVLLQQAQAALPAPKEDHPWWRLW